MNDWQKLKIRAPKAIVTLLSDWLDAYGSHSVTITAFDDEGIFEPTSHNIEYWGDNLIIALFEADLDLTDCIQDIFNEFPELDQNFIKIEKLENENWIIAWQKYFKPIQINENFWVCSSHQQCPDSNAVVLKCDPGMAFGTGNHATTQLCLAWLANNNLHEKTIIDYGTGSGILAIAALLLNAKHSIGVDIDPTALEVAKENAQKNMINTESFDLYLSKDTPNIKADIVVANILLHPLKQLKTALLDLLKQDGILILSGILDSQKEILKQYYIDVTTCIFEETLNDWSLLVLKKHV